MEQGGMTKYICPMHGPDKKVEFEPYEGMRFDVRNEPWCKECQDEFDSIDWDEVNERRHEYGRGPIDPREFME
jgi:hypothetical protein